MFLIFLISLIISFFYICIIINDKSLLIKSYFVISLIAFPLQGLFLSITKFSHPLYEYQNLSIIFQSLLYASFFGLIIFLSYRIFNKLTVNFNLSINENSFFFKKDFLNTNLILTFSITIFIIILLSEVILIGYGSFFSNPSFARCSGIKFLVDFDRYFIKIDGLKNFHQPIKLLAETKFLLLLFLGEIYRNFNNNLKIKYFYFFLFFILLLFSAFKGSKVSAGLVILFYLFSNRNLILNNRMEIKKKFFIYLKLFSSLIFFTLIVKFISHFRNIFYSDYTLVCKKMTAQVMNSILVQELSEVKSFFLIDLFVGRMNYLIPFSKAYEYVMVNGFLNSKIYLYNLIGFIPRFLWPNKPILTNDMHIHAYHFGITGHIKTTLSYDNLFSVSFRPEGETFIYFGYYGLLIAFFVGCLFSLVNKLQIEKNIGIYIFYIYLIYLISTSDVYFLLIPSLIGACFSFMFFASIFYILKKIK